MSYIVFLALLLLITLLGCYWMVESNRRKAIEAEKKRFNQRVKEINNDFKSKLIDFSEGKLIRPKNVSRLSQITSNFFVVQAHNEENLAHLEYISDLLINTIIMEASKAQTPEELDQLADRLQYFMAELPYNGIEYNKSFYQESLPSLIEVIKYQPPTMPSDEQAKELNSSNPKDINQENQNAELSKV
ncbi:hypothetical protein AAEU31_10825 [Pseudoalteromonas sp. SSMSWG5]|jgi:hypothetical protein|uniref:hypothetical protein n=1 Tax=Pseudoalteromonas TaxID=53246 RepID=UPI000C529B30|nr:MULTISPECIES: hypothetical protein [unclassified Pseudoalteromonas]MBD56130.1 hypothetical protein [Pseudoalteromonas sp.]MBU75482.1 hypothetical protein [Pseudoalteromonadaceae bacterium]MCF2899899.1 hypothetical protein [Pseudoalteromonas sp. OFAV1]MCF2921818.1 hypothetical protein [Pseudoalteromonas sp. APAL1]MCO7252100.1 hypothetical protein [Pseudoalteromonas sp. Ps84H-4]|tara:strand:+ start:1745 stop:2308 length:564 start_codon:yes stop_codon:yes gene_type:complete